MRERKSYREIPAEDEQAILDAWDGKNGKVPLGVHAISKRLNHCTGTVRKYLKKHGRIQ